MTISYHLGKIKGLKLLVYTLETLGERLSHARATAKERGVPCIAQKVTQGDVANVIGVTRQAIVRIEKNVNGTSNDNLKKVAEFLKVDPAWLITGFGEMTDTEDRAAEQKSIVAISEGAAERALLDKVLDPDFVGQVSAIHALTGQILENADKGRNNKPLLMMLDQAVKEYLQHS